MSTVLVAARPGKSRAAVADLRNGQPTCSSAPIATARLPVLALVASELCSSLHALCAEGIELVLEPFPSDQIATIDRTELERVSTVLLAPGSLDPSLRRAIIAKFRQLQKAVVVISPTDAEACVILAEGATAACCAVQPRRRPSQQPSGPPQHNCGFKLDSWETLVRSKAN